MKRKLNFAVIIISLGLTVNLWSQGYNLDEDLVTEHMNYKVETAENFSAWFGENYIVSAEIPTIEYFNIGSHVLSPDQKLLAAHNDDGKVYLWSSETGDILQFYQGAESGFNSLAFSETGKLLAGASGYNEPIQIWNSATGEELYTLETAVGTGTSLAFSVDDTLLACGGYNLVESSDHNEETTGIIEIWDLEKGSLIHSLYAHNTGVAELKFSADRKKLYSCDLASGYVKIWNVESGNIISSFNIQSNIWSMAISPDERYAFLGDNDGKIMLYEISTWELLGSFWGSRAEDVIVTLNFSPDGKFVVSGSQNGVIRLWDMDTLTAITLDDGEIRMGYKIPDFSILDSKVINSSGAFETWSIPEGEYLGHVIRKSEYISKQ